VVIDSAVLASWGSLFHHWGARAANSFDWAERELYFLSGREAIYGCWWTASMCNNNIVLLINCSFLQAEAILCIFCVGGGRSRPRIWLQCVCVCVCERESHIECDKHYYSHIWLTLINNMGYDSWWYVWIMQKQVISALWWYGMEAAVWLKSI
jgi:hypothetical protein